MDTRTRSLPRYSGHINNNPCSVREQLIRREPCYLGNSLKQFHRRHVSTILDVTNRRLAHLATASQLRLRNAGSFSIRLKCLHMGSHTIGITYSRAIGHIDSGLLHAFGMAKQLRSFYDRAMEALAERFPKEKPTQGRLAMLAGVKQPTVNDWKDGYPGMDTAVRLATALGVCVEWLFTERGPKRPPDADNPTLALLLSQLDDRQKAKLAKLAEVLKEPE